MVKKRLGFYSFILLVLFVPLFSVTAEDGYVLITYYEFSGGLPSPGDTITIRAELYKSENRVTESVEINIERISSLSDTSVSIPMIDNENGIFSHALTISIDESSNNVYINFKAYVDDNNIADDSLYIELSNEVEVDLFRPMNSISHQSPMPGDVFEVTTYIPGVDDGRIDVSEPSIAVSYQISGSNSPSNQIASNFVGNGFYSASFTIPTDISFNTENGVPRLSIDIGVEFNEKTYWDGFYLSLGGLKVFTKSSLIDSSLTVNVLVLGEDYLPVEDATVNASIFLQKSPSERLDFIIMPNTDSEGRSTRTSVIDLTDLRTIQTSVIVTENDRFGQGNAYLSLDTDYSYDYFSVIPDEDYLKDLLGNYEKGASFNMIAMKDGEALEKTQIEVYVHWTHGVIRVQTVTTDQNGRFKLEFDWPQDLDQEYTEIDFIYNNGTEWFSSEFTLSRAPEDLIVNSGTRPDISYEDYADYQIATIEYQLPPAIPVGVIYTMAVYEGISLFSSMSQGTSLFVDNSGSMGNNFAKPEGRNIHTQNVIDLTGQLKYLVIIIQYPDQYSETGTSFVIWLIDGKGNTVGTGSPTLQNLTGFDAIAIGLMLLSVISITYLKGRKRFN
ncbi:MAG: hypothetical protein ACW964_05590 [Candidatus Hodarchaeales archaeon]|jgi:hypothetical protein